MFIGALTPSERHLESAKRAEVRSRGQDAVGKDTVAAPRAAGLVDVDAPSGCPRDTFSSESTADGTPRQFEPSPPSTSLCSDANWSHRLDGRGLAVQPLRAGARTEFPPGIALPPSNQRRNPAPRSRPKEGWCTRTALRLLREASRNQYIRCLIPYTSYMLGRGNGQRSLRSSQLLAIELGESKWGAGPCRDGRTRAVAAALWVSTRPLHATATRPQSGGQFAWTSGQRVDSRPGRRTANGRSRPDRGRRSPFARCAARRHRPRPRPQVGPTPSSLRAFLWGIVSVTRHGQEERRIGPPRL